MLITIALSHFLRESKSGFARCVPFSAICHVVSHAVRLNVVFDV